MGPDRPGCACSPTRDRALSGARTAGAVGLGLSSLVGFALVPKCPLCIAAYLAALAPLALSPWLGPAIGVAALALLVAVRLVWRAEP